MDETKKEAEKDGVVVPQTLEEYCLKASKEHDESHDALNLLDDDFYDYNEDDSDDEEYGQEDNDDSGQGEN